jgi:hypothetical protein
MFSDAITHSKSTGHPHAVIPQWEWGDFLNAFSRRHRRWIAQIETYDIVTGERVTTVETPLESIEFDQEDINNPRINVTVHLDNKVIKHILFLPSKLVLEQSTGNGELSLAVDTVNTNTVIRFRPRKQPLER